MVFNVLVFKKWAALISAGFIPTICFTLGNIYFGLWWGLGLFFAGLLLSVVVANLMLRNPFTAMLEGKGILALTLDSTGIIRPFIVSVQQPYVRAFLDGEKVDDVFDRSTVHSLAVPKQAGVMMSDEDSNRMVIELDEDLFNRGRFALFHYPVLLWNNQIKTIITKDFLSDQEKLAFAEHGVIYLNRKLEELTSVTRDFARYVVELTKPKKGLMSSWWVWLILAVFIVVVLMLVGPSLFNTVKDLFGGAGSGAVSNVIGSATDQIIVPRGG